MTQVTKLTWEAKKTPLCRVNLQCSQHCNCSHHFERSPRALLLEFWGRRAAQSYFPRQNTGLSVWGRERALLSSSKDKRALRQCRGPKSVLSVLPWTWEQNTQSADIPLSTQLLASPTESKNRKSNKRRPTPTSRDTVARKQRLTRPWALHSCFSMSKAKKIQSTAMIHRLQMPLSGPQTGDRNKSF